MSRSRTLILGYDFSLRKKIPWNKIGTSVDKIIAQSTGDYADGYVSLPEELPIKFMGKLRFLVELILTWNRKYDRVILLEDYPHLKAYSALVRAKDHLYLRGDNEIILFSIFDTLGEELRTFLKALSMRLTLLRYGYLINIRKSFSTENNYGFIERAFKKIKKSYCHKASVIIPVYNRKVMLSKTLASLSYQTYPDKLFEVIIADDGSGDGVEELVQKYKKRLNIKIVSQKDMGYRLAAIRNKALKMAKNDVIISLDCDVIPAPRLIEEYMKWFQATDENIVVLGILKHVDADSLTEEDILENPSLIFSLKEVPPPLERRASKHSMSEWRLAIFKKTNYLKKHHYPYVMASGGNMAFWRKSALQIGGFDEDFIEWGGEDDVFNYKLYKKGAYFIPELKAIGMHQRHNGDAFYRSKGRVFTRKLLGKKIPMYRHFLAPRDEWEIPKVSIFIRSYNSKKYVKDAIESALNQSYKDLEVCIIDDGSTDGTVNLIKKYFKDERRVRWIIQDHRGPAAAMNAAINMSRGEYVGQLDSDDLLYPTAVEELVRFMDKHPEYGVVYSDYEVIDEDGNFLYKEKNFKRFNKNLLMRKMIIGPFRMFRIKYWYRITMIDEDLPAAEDYDLFIKLSAVCNFHHYNKVLYKYRRHDYNITRDNVMAQHYVDIVHKRVFLRSRKARNSHLIGKLPLSPLAKKDNF
jgi:chondroitin synthase